MPARITGFREVEAKLRRLARSGRRIVPGVARTRLPPLRGRILRDVGRQAARNLRRLAR